MGVMCENFYFDFPTALSPRQIILTAIWSVLSVQTSSVDTFSILLLLLEVEVASSWSLTSAMVSPEHCAGWPRPLVVNLK